MQITLCSGFLTAVLATSSLAGCRTDSPLSAEDLARGNDYASKLRSHDFMGACEGYQNQTNGLFTSTGMSRLDRNNALDREAGLFRSSYEKAFGDITTVKAAPFEALKGHTVVRRTFADVESHKQKVLDKRGWGLSWRLGVTLMLVGTFVGGRLLCRKKRETDDDLVVAVPLLFGLVLGAYVGHRIDDYIASKDREPLATPSATLCRDIAEEYDLREIPLAPWTREGPQSQ